MHTFARLSKKTNLLEHIYYWETMLADGNQGKRYVRNTFLVIISYVYR